MFGIGPVALAVIRKGGGSFPGEGRVSLLSPEKGRIGQGSSGEPGIKTDK
jgi:hypothetical protein